MVMALLVFVGGFAAVGVSAASDFDYDFNFMPVRLNFDAIERVIIQLVQNQDRQLLNFPGIGQVKEDSRSVGSSLKLPGGKRHADSTPQSPDLEVDLASDLLELQLEPNKISPDILRLDRGEDLSAEIEELGEDQEIELGELKLEEDDQDDEEKDKKDKDDKDKGKKDQGDENKDKKDKDGKEKNKDHKDENKGRQGRR